MFRFLNKKLLYTVNYGKQINIKPQNYENLFTFISSVFSVFLQEVYMQIHNRKNA